MELVLTTRDQLEKLLRRVVDESVTPVESVAKPKEWLTNKEALNFLGLSKATLQRLRRSGQLSFSKVNGSIFYERKDIIDLLERNRRSR